ncbi:MAG TPA: MBL fold metallo-hydrolase [Pseudonocardiaceae bacterium]|jgi:glyoxylase-like metal-dependent hydrolase (beta-lactamase superfamily II)|nr:MBL fold metallo-hydrolase [Pseudonocardiaceae bacterium]
MAVRIDKVVTSGQFHLDGGTWDVDNNVWLLGDDDQVLVIDAAHDAFAIAEAVAGREVVGIVCTHGHDDHVDAAPALAKITKAKVALHPADDVLWQMAHPHAKWDRPLADGDVIEVAGVTARVIHTPGHSPGSVCLHVPELGAVFTGDTLFHGGPGATGRSYSDRDAIEQSIRQRLFELDPETVVHTGHGEDTKIHDEATALGNG